MNTLSEGEHAFSLVNTIFPPSLRAFPRDSPMSNPWHDVMTNDYSAYSDELVGARLLHGVYDDAMSPEVSQRPLTGSPHNFLPCRAHGVQNCGSITPTSPSAVRLLSPISNHPRELTRMDGSHLHVYAPRVAHATGGAVCFRAGDK